MGRAVSAFVCVNRANCRRCDCASTLRTNIENDRKHLQSIDSLSVCSVQSSSYRFNAVVVVAFDRRLQ